MIMKLEGDYQPPMIMKLEGDYHQPPMIMKLEGDYHQPSMIMKLEGDYHQPPMIIKLEGDYHQPPMIIRRQLNLYKRVHGGAERQYNIFPQRFHSRLTLLYNSKCFSQQALKHKNNNFYNKWIITIKSCGLFLEDYPNGTWLGNEDNPEMRVRVPITPRYYQHYFCNLSLFLYFE